MAKPVSAQLYAEVQQFYAQQIRLLGDGEIARWAQTFITDAVFVQDARPDRRFARSAKAIRRGRDDISAAAGGAKAQRRDESVVRRYWLGMITVTPQGDGSLHTSYQGVLVNTVGGAEVDVFLSTRGSDVLVLVAGQWQVKHRRINHDDVPSGGTEDTRT